MALTDSVKAIVLVDAHNGHCAHPTINLRQRPAGSLHRLLLQHETLYAFTQPVNDFIVATHQHAVPHPVGFPATLALRASGARLGGFITLGSPIESSSHQDPPV